LSAERRPQFPAASGVGRVEHVRLGYDESIDEMKHADMHMGVQNYGKAHL
jgi:hypothetical protein